MKNELTNETNIDFRSAITAAEDFLKSMPDEDKVDLDPKHYFAQGLYARELFIPAGTIVTGAIHKQQHICIVIGEIIVSSEDCPEGRHFTGYNIFVTEPGIKRIVRSITDSYFITFHNTNAKNVKTIEKKLVTYTYEEFEEYRNKLSQRKPKAIGESE